MSVSTSLEISFPFKNLLVDLDGTLLDSDDLLARIRFVRKMVVRLKDYVGWKNSLRVLDRIQRAFESPRGPSVNSLKAAQVFADYSKLPLGEADRILTDFTNQVFPAMKKFFYPKDGAYDFIDWAKKKLQAFLATNPVWPEEIVKLRLEWAGIEADIFEMITHARLMHACKPRLDYFKEILEKKNLNPQECLLIGNEVQNDLPASQVGISVFLITKSKQLKNIELPKGSAPSWSGDYKVLKKFLEQNLSR